MSGGEVLVRLLAGLSPMVPSILAVLVLTVLALVVLLLTCHNSWVQDGNFRVAGLFFGMTAKGGLRLSCAWLKLIFLLVFIVGFQKLELLNYFMVLVPGLILALSDSSGKKILSGLAWLALQIAGLLATNLICGYIREFSAGIVFLLVYIAMGLFLAFFSIFLFLNELSDISGARDIDPRSVWNEEDERELRDEEQP